MPATALTIMCLEGSCGQVSISTCLGDHHPCTHMHVYMCVLGPLRSLVMVWLSPYWGAHMSVVLVCRCRCVHACRAGRSVLLHAFSSLAFIVFKALWSCPPLSPGKGPVVSPQRALKKLPAPLFPGLKGGEWGLRHRTMQPLTPPLVSAR